MSVSVGSYFASLFGLQIKDKSSMKVLGSRKYGHAKYSLRMMSVGLYIVLISFFPFEDYMADLGRMAFS